MTKLSRLLVFANLADLATFGVAVALIPAGSALQEQNPLIAGVFATWGLIGVVVVKAGLALGLAWWHDREPTTTRWWSKPIRRRAYGHVKVVAISVATVAFAVGAGFNVASVVWSIR